jgi:Tol biopolymer transport system component
MPQGNDAPPELFDYQAQHGSWWPGPIVSPSPNGLWAFFPHEVGTCRWSPHADWLLVGVPGALYSMRGDGSERHRFEGEAVPRGASWSADGSRISYYAVGSLTSSTLRPDRGDSQIRVTAPEGGDITWIWSNAATYASYFIHTFDGTHAYSLHLANDSTGADTLLSGTAYPNWSPDGARLAYQTTASLWTENYTTIRADGSNEVKLPHGLLTWFGDGQHVAVVDNNDRTIRIVSLDGSPARTIWNNTETDQLVGLWFSESINDPDLTRDRDREP